METINAATKNLAGPELRQLSTDVGLCGIEHIQHGFVGIDDVEVLIGNHHVGGDVIQRTLDPRIGTGGLCGLLQCRKHARYRRQHTVWHRERQFEGAIAVGNPAGDPCQL